MSRLSEFEMKRIDAMSSNERRALILADVESADETSEEAVYAAQLLAAEQADTCVNSAPARVRFGGTLKRIAAIAAMVAVVAGITVGVYAGGFVNGLEQLEESSGFESCTELAELKTGALYTVENHSYYPDGSREPEYSYKLYNELPEGTDPASLSQYMFETDYSDTDEHRSMCVNCNSLVWTIDDPVEYSYQRPSADVPEKFHIRTFKCALCGYGLEYVEQDGKPIPYGLKYELEREMIRMFKHDTPEIDGVELIEDPSGLKYDTEYRVLMFGTHEIAFYENTPENIAAVSRAGGGSRGTICPSCHDSDKIYAQTALLDRVERVITVDDYGDEYELGDVAYLNCARCGKAWFAIRNDW